MARRHGGASDAIRAGGRVCGQKKHTVSGGHDRAKGGAQEIASWHDVVRSPGPYTDNLSGGNTWYEAGPTGGSTLRLRLEGGVFIPTGCRPKTLLLTLLHGLLLKDFLKTSAGQNGLMPLPRG